MFKKALSLLLSLMLIVTSLSVTILSVSAASGDTGYFVSGSAALTGAEWSQIPADDTVMTANDDGTYSKVFTDVQPASGLILKVVGYVEKEDGTYDLTWYGVDGGEDNLQINVTEACDVTVTFDPATKKIDATGAGVSVVSDLVVDNMYAVGAGSGGFLYDVVWDPADDANIMEEVAPGVYQITYEDVEVYDNYEFKFAANGAYADQWGAAETGFTAPIGEDFALVQNSNTANITLAIPGDEDGYVNVTLTIDISNFDYATKEGATARVDVEYPEDPQPTDPQPTDPQPTDPVPTDPQPTDPEPTDPQPTDPDAPYLTVNATSTANYFGDNVKTEYNNDTNEVTVTYYIDPSKNILDTEWYVNYDPEVLTLSTKSTYCPIMVKTGGVVLNRDEVGRVKFNATNLSLYDFTSTEGQQVFASVTFTVNDISAIAPVNTTVSLDLSVLRVSMVEDPSDPFSQSDKNEEVLLVDDYVVLSNDKTATVTVDTLTEITPESTYVPAQDTTAPVEPDTTAPVEPDTTAPVEPDTTAPVEPDTTAPAEPEGLNITATSNLFPSSSYKAEAGEEVTVNYYFDADKDVLNTQWLLSYDPSVLRLTSSNFMPQMTKGAVYYTTDVEGVVEGSAVDLTLYSVEFDQPFVQATFEVIGEGDTTVNLDVTTLIVSVLNPDTESSDETQEETLVLNSVPVSTDDLQLGSEIVGSNEDVPTDPVPTDPQPTDPVDEPTDPVDEPTTPVDEPTTPVDEPTTPVVVPGDTTPDATSGVNGGSTADTPNGSTNNGGTVNGGAVQTGSVSMAIVILLVLLSATGIMFFARKRVK